MALDPGAVHRLLPENRTASVIRPTQIILHTAVDAPGPTSLFPYFSRLDVSVETHMFVKLDGMREQYMDTERKADGNHLANIRSDGTGAISVETEDEGNPEGVPWTDKQLASLKRFIDWACKTHGIPRRVCQNWADPGIGYHSMWGAPSPWTVVRGKTCPGSIRIKQFNQIIVPWLAEPRERPANRKIKHMLVRNQVSGAVLHVLGGAATLLIDNSADFVDFLNAGVPVVNVRPEQFKRYENLRVDK